MIKQTILLIIVMIFLLFSATSLEQNYSDNDFKKFLIIAQEFSEEHSYNISNYNCVNYTNDLYNLVKSLNITIKKIRGCPPIESEDSRCHRFLRLEVEGFELDFEPISAKFTNYSNKYPDQIEVIW